MTLSEQLVIAIRERIANGIPEHILAKGRLHIADTLVIALAARKDARVVQQAIDGITIGQTAGVSPMIGSQLTLPPAYAAFVNCALAHALDFDDIQDMARVHPTPVMLAAALAAGDVVKSPKLDVVSAIVIGNEIVCRLSYAIEPKGTGKDANWFLSQLLGYIGAAITAGLVLDLNDEQLVNAIGLAYMQAAGGKEAGVGVGSQARAIYPAFAAMGGVQAAFLAAAGVTAPATSLDGKTGLFQSYFDRTLLTQHERILLNETDWLFAQTAIKLYPCCRYSHPYVQAAINLFEKIDVQQIEQITIGVNRTANVLCEPLAARCNPITLQDAKFSIPFIVAFTLIHGEVHLNNLTTATLQGERVIALAQKIQIAVTQEDVIGIPIGDITIKTSKGTIREKVQLQPTAIEEEVKKKFIACCQFADIEEPLQLWALCMQQIDYNIVAKLPIVEPAF